MKKSTKITYWIATVWLALGMVSSGVIQLLQLSEEVESMRRLGYPVYFLRILGVWKLLGVLAILLPRRPLLKEWAYAGFFFTASGALVSHAAIADPAVEFIGPALLLLLTVASWWLRPADRKIQIA